MNARRSPRLSLDLLRGFRAAARHLSFTRAAQELCVTQSAVSREVKTLEEQIGQPLFHRVHRALQLTAAGAELYAAADQALRQLDAVTDRLSGLARTLTVITTPALASLWLAPKLPRFNRTRPDTEVRVVTSNDKPELERDQIDIAIRFVGKGGDGPAAEPLMSCECFPVCAPSLAQERARPLRTPADLANHVRLDYESVRDGERWSEWGFWFNAMKIKPVKPVSTLHFPQFDQCFPAAIDGEGVAIGVAPHVDQLIAAGRLCMPFGLDAIVNRGQFFLQVHRDAAARDGVQEFVAWLRKEARRDSEILAAPARSGVRRRQRRSDDAIDGR